MEIRVIYRMSGHSDQVKGRLSKVEEKRNDSKEEEDGGWGSDRSCTREQCEPFIINDASRLRGRTEQARLGRRDPKDGSRTRDISKRDTGWGWLGKHAWASKRHISVYV